MPDLTVSSDIDAFLQAVNKAAARNILGLYSIDTGTDADKTISAAGSIVVTQTAPLTSARVWTLPAASAVGAGSEVIIQAGAGVSATNTLSIRRGGSDTINAGTADVVIGAAYGWRRLISDGTSEWRWDSGILRSSSNLSDVASASTALSNLGGAPLSLNTTSPNNTVNAFVIAPTSGSTNVDLVVTPKGTGAFIVGGVPDGTTTGGNKRGARSIDICLSRSSAINVASGADCVAIGTSIYAPTADGVAIGNGANASGGNGAAALGRTAIASGAYSVALGRDTTASVAATIATGIGSIADRISMRAHRAAGFSGVGDNQAIELNAIIKTTNATPTALRLDGSGTRITIPSGKVLAVNVSVLGIKSDGSAVAEYSRRVRVKNVAGTTTLIGTVLTVGTDYEDNAATDIAITADDANDSLEITVTGITGETWRWLAVISGGEVAYGT